MLGFDKNISNYNYLFEDVEPVDKDYLKFISDFCSLEQNMDLFVECCTSSVSRMLGFPLVSFFFIKIPHKSVISQVTSVLTEALYDFSTARKLKKFHARKELITITDAPFLLVDNGNSFSFSKIQKILFMPIRGSNRFRYAYSGIIFSMSDFNYFKEQLDSHIFKFLLPEFVSVFQMDSFKTVAFPKGAFSKQSFVNDFFRFVLENKEEIVRQFKGNLYVNGVSYPFTEDLYSVIQFYRYGLRFVTYKLLKDFFESNGLDFAPDLVYNVKEPVELKAPRLKILRKKYVHYLKEFIEKNMDSGLFVLSNRKIKCFVEFFREFYKFICKNGFIKESVKEVIADLIRTDLIDLPLMVDKGYMPFVYGKTMRIGDYRTYGILLKKHKILSC